MSDLLKTNQLEGLTAEIEDMREQLSAARDCYEAICAERGIELPYPKTVP